MKPNLQPSTQRLRALAAQLRKGEDYITDWDCYYVCQGNPFLWSQLKGLVLEPVQAQIDEAKAKQLQAHKDLISFRGKLRRTCAIRRQDLEIRESLHYNRYSRLMLTKAINASAQQRWDAFLSSVEAYRAEDVHPYGSFCEIYPVADADWIPVQPPIPATTIPEHVTRAQSILARKQFIKHMRELRANGQLPH